MDNENDKLLMVNLIFLMSVYNRYYFLEDSYC